jgi:hypothetical protein
MKRYSERLSKSDAGVSVMNSMAYLLLVVAANRLRRYQCFPPDVADSQGGFSPDFDHMTLVVTLNRRWLVDVGFGDSFVEPLLLDEEIEQQQGTQTFRIISADSHLVLMRRSGAEEWKPQIPLYSATLSICRLRRDVSLSPNISAVTLHQIPSLFVGDV